MRNFMLTGKSHDQLHPVKSQFNICRQIAVDLFMEPHMVTQVGEISLIRPDPPDQLKRFCQIEVRMMRRMMQSAQDQYLHTLKIFDHRLVEGFYIGQISEPTKIITYNIERTMADRQSLYSHIPYQKFIPGRNFIEDHRWRSRIFFISKYVGKSIPDILKHAG